MQRGLDPWALGTPNVRRGLDRHRYNRGPYWIEGCAEISKLHLRRLVARVVEPIEFPRKMEEAGVDGSEAIARVRPIRAFSTGCHRTRWTRAEVVGQSL